MVASGHRVAFTCDGRAIDVECEAGESLLLVLRERLGIISVKDGCAPQGQCGCCTVLVDGAPRVACVTPVGRVAGRSVTTLAGLDPEVRGRLVHAFVETGASQCGFCTPGILVRVGALVARDRVSRADIDRALGAHLCRCTGWQSIVEAVERVASGAPTGGAARRSPRDLDAAARRAALEGGVPQRVGPEVPAGAGGFADDTAPRDALVAVPLPPGADPVAVEAMEAAGHRWVVASSLADARARAGKVQGRRTTVEERPPIPLPEAVPGGVRLATGWVEPAYLEPDASWCVPGGLPASPLANGGAFGAKVASAAPAAARELADRLGSPVRVVFSREDCVRLGPKRPPVAAAARWRPGRVEIRGRVAHGAWGRAARWPVPYRLTVDPCWEPAPVAGPPVAATTRAAGLAEQAALVEGALMAAGVDRAGLVDDERVAAVLLATAARAGEGVACAGAHVLLDPDAGTIARVEVRVAAGDPLDDVVLRSYCIGAAHMALGWVCSEGLAVDETTGEVLDLTIRSFGVLSAARTPPIDVVIVDDPLPPQPGASDAVFAAVAAATWNALADAEGSRPEVWPARQTRAARALRSSR